MHGSETRHGETGGEEQDQRIKSLVEDGKKKRQAKERIQTYRVREIGPKFGKTKAVRFNYNSDVGQENAQLNCVTTN